MSQSWIGALPMAWSSFPKNTTEEVLLVVVTLLKFSFCPQQRHSNNLPLVHKKWHILVFPCPNCSSICWVSLGFPNISMTWSKSSLSCHFFWISFQAYGFGLILHMLVFLRAHIYPSPVLTLKTCMNPLFTLMSSARNHPCKSVSLPQISVPEQQTILLNLHLCIDIPQGFQSRFV